jgi:hypothetical protein
MSNNILYGSRVDSKVASMALAQPKDIKVAHKMRLDTNTRTIKNGLEQLSVVNPGLRLDAGDLTARAYHFARELEHIYQEVLREEYAPNNALRLFSVDSSVPAGANVHTVRRIQHEGEARYYRANASDMGSTGARRVEKQFPIHPIVTSIRINFFEQMASGFANSNLRSELEFAARRVMEDFLNDKTWNGDEDQGVVGVKNYPWVPKTFSLVPFNDVTSADAILAEMHRLANNASEVSKQTFAPNRMIMGVKLHNYLSTRKRSATTDQTILQAFLQDNPYITSVDAANELDGAGPNGEDMMILDRAGDRSSIANVVPQGFTMLPIQQVGFDFEIPCYMLHGGVVMRYPLNNLVAYVNR